MEVRTGSIRKGTRFFEKKEVKADRCKGHLIPRIQNDGYYNSRNIECSKKMKKLKHHYYSSFINRNKNNKTVCSDDLEDTNQKYIYNENSFIGGCRPYNYSKKLIAGLVKYYNNKKDNNFVFEKKRYKYVKEGESKEKMNKTEFYLGDADDNLFNYYLNE